jgi:hypothetical protein
MWEENGSVSRKRASESQREIESQWKNLGLKEENVSGRIYWTRAPKRYKLVYNPYEYYIYKFDFI